MYYVRAKLTAGTKLYEIIIDFTEKQQTKKIKEIYIDIRY